MCLIFFAGIAVGDTFDCDEHPSASLNRQQPITIRLIHAFDNENIGLYEIANNGNLPLLLQGYMGERGFELFPYDQGIEMRSRIGTSESWLTTVKVLGEHPSPTAKLSILPNEVKTFVAETHSLVDTDRPSLMYRLIVSTVDRQKLESVPFCYMEM